MPLMIGACVTSQGLQTRSISTGVTHEATLAHRSQAELEGAVRQWGLGRGKQRRDRERGVSVLPLQCCEPMIMELSAASFAVIVEREKNELYLRL
jgi:hypothetical protein